MATSPDVIIVGAGHNGLTAGSYLARAGKRVLVLEATDKVGGMTSTNPVLPGAPHHLINEGAMDSSLWRTTRIAQELELETRYGLVELEADPPYVFLDEDGSSLCIHRDPHRTAEEIRRFSPADARAYIDLANTLESLMDMAVPFMNTNPVRPRVGGILRGAAHAARHPKRLGPLGHFFSASHAAFVDERFADRRVKALLAALPCFAPMSEDGTAWVLIYFGLIHRAGVGRFQGGTGAITNALARCFAAAGGEVRFGAEVDQLLVSGGRVRGVRLTGGEEMHAQVVLTTNNVKVPLTRWLPEDALSPSMRERVQHIPTSSTHASSFKVDVALSGRLTLDQHQENRRDGIDLRKPALVWASFEDHVAAWESCARGEVPDGLPGVGIIPTGMDPSQAPAGQDTFWWWTGIAPVRPRTEWEELAGPTSERLLGFAGRYINGLKDLELARQVNTPVTLEARFRSPDGNVYHVDPTATRFGPLRPAPGLAGYSTPIDGLFISGGGTHPSAGICGVPGQQAARVITRRIDKT